MEKNLFISKILELDQIANGSIISVYKQCGKHNCKCYSDKNKRHGPYYLWTRKENGKTITKTLNGTQLKKCKKAIKNMEKLNKYIERWKKESLFAILNE